MSGVVPETVPTFHVSVSPASVAVPCEACADRDVGVRRDLREVVGHHDVVGAPGPGRRHGHRVGHRVARIDGGAGRWVGRLGDQVAGLRPDQPVGDRDVHDRVVLGGRHHERVGLCLPVRVIWLRGLGGLPGDVEGDVEGGPAPRVAGRDVGQVTLGHRARAAQRDHPVRRPALSVSRCCCCRCA